jgi:hypothetical protein
MVMVGTGITGTIAVSKKITQSSRSKPLLSRHLTVLGPFLFQDCCNGGDRLTVSRHAHSYWRAFGKPAGTWCCTGWPVHRRHQHTRLPWSTNVRPCAARIPDGRGDLRVRAPGWVMLRADTRW